MQPSTNVNIAAMQTEQVVLAQRPQSTLNVRVIRALAITQIAFGALSVILGIIPFVVISNFWMNFIGFGIWFGVWIVVTGIIGIFSARKPQNGALNGTNMGFNIFCSVVSITNGSFFAGAVAYYDQCKVRQYRTRYADYYGRYVSTSGYYEGDSSCKNKSAGLAIYSLLMLLMIAEFFVSLFISIYCCKGCNCCCRTNNDQRVMLQQPVGYSANGSAMITTNTGYPQAAYPGTAIMHSSGAPVVFQTYPQQGQMLFSQNPHQSQMMVPQNAQQGQMIADPTNTGYVSGQHIQQPPDFQKSQLDHTDINTPR